MAAVTSAILAFQRAVADGDSAALSASLHDESVHTYPTGIVVSKARYLQDMASRQGRVLSLDTEDLRLHLHRDLAVATMRMLLRLDFAGKQHSMTTQATQVWKLDGSRWLCIAVHHCELP